MADSPDKAPARSAGGTPERHPAIDHQERHPALIRRLLLGLMVPLLLIVAATGAVGVMGAQHLTDRTFDRWLVDAARSLAAQVRFDKPDRPRLQLGGDAESILAFDAVDRTFYAVRQGPNLVAGHRTMPLPTGALTAFEGAELFDAHVGGQPVRVALVRVEQAPQAVEVYVAETLIKRQAVRRDLQLMLVPLAVLLVAAALAIRTAVSWTLEPLQTIAARWLRQSSTSLDAISLQDVPRELMPFAGALNRLFERIHDVLARERRFTANAAHQIRTPLTALQLGLSRAAAAPDAATMRGVIEELQQTTRRTSRLLQQLLALGRLDPETTHDLPRREVDLAELCTEVGQAHLPDALARGITFELLLPPGPLRATVQPELLSEAVGNLVDNALRYTPSGGRVHLLVEPARPGSGHDPCITVEDSGPGIPEAERPLMLERFVRGTQSTTDGTGLGLAIAQEIAQLHGTKLVLGESALGGLSVRLGLPDAPTASR